MFVGTVSDEEAELKWWEIQEMFLSEEYPIQTKCFHILVWVTETYFDDVNVPHGRLPAQSFLY